MAAQSETDGQSQKDRSQTNQDRSWRNTKHQEIIVELVRRIKKERHSTLSIGVVSPYRLQATELQRRLQQEGFTDVLAATVHKFQGGEKDVIVFDTVASNSDGGTFLIDDGLNDEAKILLNVAITRAKRQVWIVANTRFLKKALPGRLITKIVSDHFDHHERIDARRLLQNAVGASCQVSRCSGKINT